MYIEEGIADPCIWSASLKAEHSLFSWKYEAVFTSAVCCLIQKSLFMSHLHVTLGRGKLFFNIIFGVAQKECTETNLNHLPHQAPVDKSGETCLKEKVCINAVSGIWLWLVNITGGVDCWGHAATCRRLHMITSLIKRLRISMRFGTEMQFSM